MFLSAGQTSDYIGARALMDTIPPTEALLADRGYDADWFRNALIELGISPCIPSRAGRKVQIPHDAALLSPAPQDREHVRPPQGLETHRDPV
jgi:transposase